MRHARQKVLAALFVAAATIQNATAQFDALLAADEGAASTSGSWSADEEWDQQWFMAGATSLSHLNCQFSSMCAAAEPFVRKGVGYAVGPERYLSYCIPYTLGYKWADSTTCEAMFRLKAADFHKLFAWFHF